MPREGKTVRAILALGSNLDDPQAHLKSACEKLDRHPRVHVVANSSCFTTTPIGANAGDEFLNAAVLLETSLDPLELLKLCQQFEAAEGRERTGH